MHYTKAFPHHLHGRNDDPTEITLYIFGHCAPGQNQLHSPNLQEACSVDQLVSYCELIPNTFPGKIKLYGCETAVPDVLSKTQAFASQFFVKMRQKSFNNVRIYGYTTNIANFHTRMDDDSIHRHRNGVRNKSVKKLITDEVKLQ